MLVNYICWLTSLVFELLVFISRYFKYTFRWIKSQFRTLCSVGLNRMCEFFKGTTRKRYFFDADNITIFKSFAHIASSIFSLIAFKRVKSIYVELVDCVMEGQTYTDYITSTSYNTILYLSSYLSFVVPSILHISVSKNLLFECILEFRFVGLFEEQRYTRLYTRILTLDSILKCNIIWVFVLKVINLVIRQCCLFRSWKQVLI